MNEIDSYIESLRRSEMERRAAIQKVRDEATEFLKSYANDIGMKSTIWQKYKIEVTLNGDGFVLTQGAKFMHVFPKGERLAINIGNKTSASNPIGFVEFERDSDYSSRKLTELIVDQLVKTKWIIL